jgi:hypothetical protein
MQSLIESNASTLRGLYEAVNVTFRQRSQEPDARAAWEKAAREFQGRWDELAFPGGLRSGLKRIEAGDTKAIETAILYLEIRPFYFRAQYTRDIFTRLIKRQALPVRLQQRFDATRERLRAWRKARSTKSGGG